MYLVYKPAECPAFQWWMFALGMLLIIFVFTSLWEHFTREKENRWFKTYYDLYIYFPERKAKVALITQENTIPTTQENLEQNDDGEQKS